MERRADCTDWTAPGLGEFEALADGALAMLPQPYQKAARDLVIRVEDFAPRRLLLEMGVEDPFELTGLYDGTPMTEKSVTDQPGQPDTIWLFRRPMLDEWADRGNVSLGELVTHVLVHELAHHFGWSDDDIAQIDPWWE
ncbi:metallopeptidase family protein [Roseibacterium sp. SDUM158016]|jgi:predicted Zn-dependent protease with MMP-like domain|uniref:metallopeptidase family protein n=1 Tax=Roseicyclus sediminis TaxID=2980997 RepID=UPI0021CE0807|nr:metallopeptidase family protein [Roseibacterium sp. SDUM158016]MCU4655011.1 metallopeptidase family protein [Roseibacterium sp. SDUM158016]